MLQKLSFTFHHYQFIAKKNLIRAISGMHLLRNKAVVSSLRGNCEWRRYGASVLQIGLRYGAGDTYFSCILSISTFIQ